MNCRIIGLGGIGQIVATFLVRYLCSLGAKSRVVLIDGDRFEHGNETRMSVANFFENKATEAARTLSEACRGSAVTLLGVPEYVRPDNLARIIRSGPDETVLMCVDNHATRKLVGDYCERLDDICLLSGGNDGVGPDGSGAVRDGAAGNVQVLVRRGGRSLTPGLGDHHPEIASPADARPDEGCGVLAASAPQILFTNLTAAACLLNTWRLLVSGELHYSELVFDTRKARMGPLVKWA